jgi:hypothetical protein
MTEHELMARAVQKHRAHEHRLSFYAGCVVGGLLMLFAVQALAETVELPITATIIQCGTKYEALGQCKAGVDACCVFAPLDELEPSAGEPDGQEVSTEQTDDGVIMNFE